jgi:hypothetical protein
VSAAAASTGSDSNQSQEKLRRILKIADELMEQCRICWVRRQATRPHTTHRCQSRVCSGEEWKSFKSSLRFPPGIVCFFCLGTYGPPFNHEKPPVGERSTGSFCEYPDVLKELLYVLFKEEKVKTAVFKRLGCPVPDTLQSYKRFVGKRCASGLLGLFEVFAAYLDLREGGGRWVEFNHNRRLGSNTVDRRSMPRFHTT